MKLTTFCLVILLAACGSVNHTFSGGDLVQDRLTGDIGIIVHVWYDDSYMVRYTDDVDNVVYAYELMAPTEETDGQWNPLTQQYE